MPRVRSQLAIQAPPELLERVRAAAAARGQTVTRLLIGWIEAGLAGELPGPGAAVGGADLLERVAALEAITAELAQGLAPRTGGAPSPVRVMPPPPDGAMPPPPDGAITTAELAERTGTNRAAWNNWAAKAQPGDVRHHPQAGPWRLAGQASAPGGGPLRWLWEAA